MITTDDWWVIGDVGGNYLQWKGDRASGCYVKTRDPESAESFMSKTGAVMEITRIPELGLVPIHLTKTVMTDR